jgi:ABC-2 type transport system permease protein
MTTTSTVETPRTPLIPVRTTGWRMGYANLARKEFGQWWGTKMWWIQSLMWLIVLNGITTAIMLDNGGMSNAELMNETVMSFFLISTTAVGIAIVLTIQGAIVGEKELGTAAWVMSKPASRTSYVLSKLTAYFVGFAVTALVIPSAVFLVEAKLLLPEPVDYASFALGMGILALAMLFFIVLTLALGTVFKGRGPIAGIGIGLILVGQFFKGMLPLSLVLLTPWLLGDVAGSFAMDTTPEWNRMTPLVAIVIETLVLGYLAIMRFKREEF